VLFIDDQINSMCYFYSCFNKRINYIFSFYVVISEDQVGESLGQQINIFVKTGIGK
jgi:hypothetical protein